MDRKKAKPGFGINSFEENWTRLFANFFGDFRIGTWETLSPFPTYFKNPEIKFWGCTGSITNPWSPSSLFFNQMFRSFLTIQKVKFFEVPVFVLVKFLVRWSLSGLLFLLFSIYLSCIIFLFSNYCNFMWFIKLRASAVGNALWTFFLPTM